MIGKYNYEKYWKKRGKKYFRKFCYSELFLEQEKGLLYMLKPLEFKSVFELGCGFGRITKLVNENFKVDNYVALDISKEQLDVAKNMNKNVEFIRSDFMDYDTNQRFDLVLTSEVLMHIPPEYIEKTIAKLLKLSQKYLVCVESRGEGKLAKHVFSHDYKKYFSQYLFTEKPISNQSIYFVSK